MTASLELVGLTRTFPGNRRPAVGGVDLQVHRGEVLCLLGPSGCGKSTTLRIAAGLETADAGIVRIGGRDVTRMAPQQRDVAMVFQGFALYPHMRVRDILAFPLRMRSTPRAERDRSVHTVAELLGLQQLLDRRPAQLSGGEQQRVAMGRALVRKPTVFLFDEPLSNLDAALRNQLRVELGKLLGKLEATALYVTHDQSEAMTLGHRLAVMHEGRVEQIGSARELYESPVTTFVAEFVGTPKMNLLPATHDGVHVVAGPFRLPAGHAPRHPTLGIRPEHVHVVGESWAGESGGGQSTARAQVLRTEPHGAETHVEVQCAELTLWLRTPGFSSAKTGDELHLALDHDKIRWFDGDTGLAAGGPT